MTQQHRLRPLVCDGIIMAAMARAEDYYSQWYEDLARCNAGAEEQRPRLRRRPSLLYNTNIIVVFP